MQKMTRRRLEKSCAVRLDRLLAIDRRWATVHHRADIQHFVDFQQSGASIFCRLRVMHDAPFAEARHATCNGDQLFCFRVKRIGNKTCVMKLLKCGGGFWGHRGSY